VRACVCVCVCVCGRVKAFNTFIDDVFAFIITMPTAHRLACFRDDIVFVIYLYQRWFVLLRSRYHCQLMSSASRSVDGARNKFVGIIYAQTHKKNTKNHPRCTTVTVALH